MTISIRDKTAADIKPRPYSGPSMSAYKGKIDINEERRLMSDPLLNPPKPVNVLDYSIEDMIGDVFFGGTSATQIIDIINRVHKGSGIIQALVSSIGLPVGKSPQKWFLTILGFACLVAGVLIWNSFKDTSDNVETLIKKARKLNTSNANVKNIFASWIKELEQYKTIFLERPISGDKERAAKQVSIKLKEMQSLLSYLSKVSSEWDKIKKDPASNLVSSGKDLYEFDNELNITYKTVNTHLATIQRELKEKIQEVIYKVDNVTKKDQNEAKKLFDDLTKNQKTSEIINKRMISKREII